MINVKKGTAHSLAQTDLRGTNPNPATYGYTSGTTITAGMLCYLNAGVVTAVPTSGATTGQLKGLAINNNYDGDAIESQKIALYALDGSSIIETDQVGTLAVTSTTFPIGALVYANATTAGAVQSTYTGANGIAIGQVEGIRFLQNATPYPSGAYQASAQNYTSATETAAINAESTTSNGQPIYNPTTLTVNYKAQINIPVVSIKLFAV